jgi:hypothetical protein
MPELQRHHSREAGTVDPIIGFTVELVVTRTS